MRVSKHLPNPPPVVRIALVVIVIVRPLVAVGITWWPVRHDVDPHIAMSIIGESLEFK